MRERSCLVAFGSETGNAQEAAEELARLVQRLHFSPHLAALDDIEPSAFKNFGLVLVTMATTGQGDMPNNSRLFWKKLLRKKLPLDYLEGVSFALFGLGDSSYPKFNWAALKLDRRLSQLGGSNVLRRGEGDEQHAEGTDSIFLPWCKDLRTKLLDLFPLEKEPLPENELLQPQWLLAEASTTGLGSDHNGNVAPSVTKDVYLDVTLERNERITPQDHWQDVRQLVFQSSSAVNYVPGDILTIYPENPASHVEEFIKLMKWDAVADVPLRFVENPDYALPIKTPCPSFASPLSPSYPTLRELLARDLDLNAIPRRSFFSLIAHFTTDSFHKERLLEFADPELTDELFDYTTRPRRSTLEVLQEFDSVQMPWQWAAAVLPTLRGRQFSIASGGNLKTNEKGLAKFELLVALVRYRTVIRKIREGVCSRYLSGLPIGTKMKVKLVKGSLGKVAEPESKQTPLVMVAPGTGVAPMRALIWERRAWEDANEHRAGPSAEMAAHTESTSTTTSGAWIGPTQNAQDTRELKAEANALQDGAEGLENTRDKETGPDLASFARTAQPAPPSTKASALSTQPSQSAEHRSLQPAPCALFFGSRNRSADFFFASEWDVISQTLPLTVHAAFSRDQNRKVYVQDLIEAQRRSVYELLIERKGVLCVCGSSGRMPLAVRAAVVEAIKSEKGCGQKEAEEMIGALEKEGRYKQETW